MVQSWGAVGSREPSEHKVYILCAETRKKDDNDLFQPLFTDCFYNWSVSENEFTTHFQLHCQNLSICFGLFCWNKGTRNFFLSHVRILQEPQVSVTATVLLSASRHWINHKKTPAVKIPKTLLKTITLISAFSCFLIVFFMSCLCTSGLKLF